MQTLKEHVKQAEIYFKHKGVYKQYLQQKPKKRDEYFQKHRASIVLFQAAERYLKEVMNGRPGLPIKAWKAEAEQLAVQKKRLYGEYARAKADVRDVEVVRRCVEQLVSEGEKNRRSRREYDIEL